LPLCTVQSRFGSYLPGGTIYAQALADTKIINPMLWVQGMINGRRTHPCFRIWATPDLMTLWSAWLSSSWRWSPRRPLRTPYAVDRTCRPCCRTLCVQSPPPKVGHSSWYPQWCRSALQRINEGFDERPLLFLILQKGKSTSMAADSFPTAIWFSNVLASRPRKKLPLGRGTP